MLYQIVHRMCFLTALLLLNACSQTPKQVKVSPQELAKQKTASAAQEIVPQSLGLSTLGAGDIFEVRIFQEPELSGTFRVGSDGTFNFPLIGNLSLDGLTPNQSSEKIRKNLKAYVVNPQVSIFIKEFNWPIFCICNID